MTWHRTQEDYRDVMLVKVGAIGVVTREYRVPASFASVPDEAVWFVISGDVNRTALQKNQSRVKSQKSRG